jgi:hypothetical protein
MNESGRTDTLTPRPRMLRCDTCGALTPRVSRVVIDRGYDRSNARPLWNCPDCFERKNRERQAGDEGMRG